MLDIIALTLARLVNVGIAVSHLACLDKPFGVARPISE